MIASSLDMALAGVRGTGDKQSLTESSLLQAALWLWTSVTRKLQPDARGQKPAATHLLEARLSVPHCLQGAVLEGCLGSLEFRGSQVSAERTSLLKGGWF